MTTMRPPRRAVSCTDAVRRIQENLDDHSRDPSFKAIGSHLVHCPNCAAYYQSLKTLVRLYRNQPSPGLSVRTRKHLHTLLHKNIGCPKF